MELEETPAPWKIEVLVGAWVNKLITEIEFFEELAFAERRSQRLSVHADIALRGLRQHRTVRLEGTCP